jgi:DNA-binding SARP family transcriptional activator
MTDCSVSFGTQRIQLPGRKARALLSYLALSGKGQIDRVFLASFFWPQSDHAKARISLRQILFEIRRVLGDHSNSLLELNRETAGLVPGAYRTDIDDLLDMSTNLMSVGELHGNFRRLSDLLTEFEDIGDEYANWIAEFRNSVLLQAVEMLQAFLERNDVHLSTRKELARVILSLDEFNEGAVRHLMSALYDLQESAAALQVYNSFCDLVDEQLAAEPSAETQDLAVEIKLSINAPASGVASSFRRKGRNGVVVVPYNVLSDDPDLRFVSLGLLDEVTCRLASNRTIPVVSSNSTRHYLGADVTTRDVAETFNAKYAVFGSMRPRGEVISIATQVVDLDDEKILHALTIERPFGAALSYEVELAALIANQISPNIDQTELSRTIRFASRELEPYHLTLRAKDLLLDLSHASFVEAGELLDRAILLAPMFGPAYSMKADWHALKIWQRWSDHLHDDVAALERNAAKAIEYSPGDGRSRAILAHSRIINSEDYDGALRLFDTALTLMPNDSETLIWTVPGLAYTGDADGAIKNGLKALELSPLDPFISRYHHFISLAYYSTGAFGEAAEHGKISFELNPNHLSNLRTTIASLWASDRKSEVEPLVAHHQKIFGKGAIVYPNGSGPPFRDLANRREMVAHLRDAGLPV